MKRAFLAAALLLLIHSHALARGVSPYLPTKLDPATERQIERVLILGDKPVMTRPIAAATVLDALPAACRKDPVLCREVRRYLARYMRNWGVTDASLEGSTSSGSEKTLPNRYGLSSGSDWVASARGFWQPYDHALLSLGAVGYEDEVVPEGSLLSFGWDRAQLDLGYRARWLSPLTDSSMLVSTESATMPSVTLSNYRPLTRFGLHYELFAAEMSRSDDIVFQNGLTSGNPRLAGVHLSIEPATGWALGVNRILQYGGGARRASIGDVFDAFFSPSRFDNQDFTLDPNAEFGNQVASITSRFLFPGANPFAVYFEYAGEDTSNGKNLLLGNSALSAGIHFPHIWRRFDVAYEVSDWQNSWYVHHIYLDGLVNEGRVLGHWAGDSRQRGDGVGGQSHMARLGWQPGFGGSLDLRYRTLKNETYSGVDYERAHELTLQYARPFGPLLLGGELLTGNDVFGEDFTRFGVFMRLSSESNGSFVSPDDYSDVSRESGAELFAAAGVSASYLRIDLDLDIPTRTTTRIAPHVGVGARRAVSDRSDLGARLELGNVDGNLLLAVRALDYRYRTRGALTYSGFLGAARYDLATVAYGLYGGAGVQWRNIIPKWDLGFEVSCAFKVARDDLLPTDPIGQRPDSFYDIYGATLSLSRRF